MYHFFSAHRSCWRWFVLPHKTNESMWVTYQCYIPHDISSMLMSLYWNTCCILAFLSISFSIVIVPSVRSSPFCPYQWRCRWDTREGLRYYSIWTLCVVDINVHIPNFALYAIKVRGFMISTFIWPCFECSWCSICTVDSHADSKYTLPEHVCISKESEYLMFDKWSLFTIILFFDIFFVFPGMLVTHSSRVETDVGEIQGFGRFHRSWSWLWDWNRIE